MKPIVAIVGRPNVGKSMLFNKLTGQAAFHRGGYPRCDPGPDLWRADWNGRAFTLIDTGGIEPRTDNEMLAFMRGPGADRH